MKSLCLCLIMSVVGARVTAAEFPAGVDPDDRLLQLGLLDVTKAPYLADPAGVKDSTQAIQRAVNVHNTHRFQIRRLCYECQNSLCRTESTLRASATSRLSRPR